MRGVLEDAERKQILAALKHANWAVAGPKTTMRASAVAYFFGRQLQHDLRVPVGLIYYACGASVIESWTSRAGLEKDYEDFAAIVEGHKQKAQEYPRQLEEFKAKAAEAKAAKLAAAKSASAQGASTAA